MEDPSTWPLPKTTCRIPPGHRKVKQPFADDCSWTVDPGPCHAWKVPSTRRHGPDIAHYRWDVVPTTPTPGDDDRGNESPPAAAKGAVVMLHGLGAHTFFQFLRHANNGETKKRGLSYEGSFVQRVTTQLRLPCYGLDLEGHGYSRPSLDPTPMYMSGGIDGAVEDVKRLLTYVRNEHGWDDDDNSKIILIGHSTGCLVLTRAAQDLERNFGVDKGRFAGVISTGPLYGAGNVDGSEVATNRLNPLSHAAAMGFMTVLCMVAPKTMLSTCYVTEKDDKRDNSNIHPTVVEKSISPGNLIEKWVAGDRDLDPMFHSPYCPIYANFARSVLRELRLVHRLAPKFTTSPLFIVHSEFDPVVSYKASLRFHKVAGSKDKEIWSPESYMLHNTMLEEEGRDVVIDRICQWMEQHLE